MKDREKIDSITKYLFGCDFMSDDFDPEDHEEHLEVAEDFVERYSWNDIFESWNAYLHNNCKEPEEVINYCNLFCYYGGQDHYITDPYDFLGYIYYRVDTKKYWDEAGELIDSLSISILETAGKISSTRNPYYRSWEDPKILAVVDKYKKKNI